ncbi:MAG: flagellar export protein FliJ [Candidatus Eremiobacteraeota bacterium]|nr:flagellar export protein FliJ [Candidatus Eremiobacteraeota bacterium]
MKKFKFKLKPVLELRKNREEQVQMELALVSRRLDSALQDYNNNLEHRDKTSIKLENLKVCPGGIEDLILYQNYIEGVDHRLSMELGSIQEIRGEVDEVKRRLFNAARDRKAIEKLEEKQKNIYANMVRRLEDKFLDDMGTVRSARKGI